MIPTSKTVSGYYVGSVWGNPLSFLIKNDGNQDNQQFNKTRFYMVID